MLSQLIEQRCGLSIWKIQRLAHLLFIGVTILTYNILAMTIANSLFLSHAGSENLPLFYVLIGLVSMPAYAVFSQVVDRFSRPQLFRYMLVFAIAMALGMRLLITLDTLWVYYLIFIAIFFQWDLYNNILLPNLLMDYFTALEYKRYAPFMGMAQAVGILLGGGLTSLLSQFFTTEDMLLSLPFVCAVAIAQLIYLERSQRRIETNRSQTPVNLVEALRTFPDLVKRYPIILFLASSSFLLVIIYITSEFEY
ncbi:MAG: cyclic nucleotide-binding domain-containing protein, partial [Coleofasciculus sp. C2-GNP5-27]